jgi:hypothetical protein
MVLGWRLGSTDAGGIRHALAVMLWIVVRWRRSS